MVYNKWDKIEEKEEKFRTLEKGRSAQLKDMNYIPMIVISVWNNLRLFNVLDLCLDIFKEKNKKVNIRELNELLKDTIEKNPPHRIAGRKITIKYVTQAPVSSPVFVFFANITKGIKDNYKRYLEKEIRNKFGFTGVPVIIKFKKKKGK